LKELSFIEGLKVFLSALGLIYQRPALRRWYLKSVMITWILGVFIFLIFLALGAWGIWTNVAQTWQAGLLAGLYIFLLSFFSGSVSSALNGALVMLVAGEENLLRAYLGDRSFKIKSVPWFFKKKEILRIVISLLTSLVVWPLIFFPLTLPFGILLVAWAMGRESEASGAKLKYAVEGNLLGSQNQISFHLQKSSVAFVIGMAIFPASMAIFPVLGWIFLPVLPIAGFVSRGILEKK